MCKNKQQVFSKIRIILAIQHKFILVYFFMKKSHDTSRIRSFEPAMPPPRCFQCNKYAMIAQIFTYGRLDMGDGDIDRQFSDLKVFKTFLYFNSSTRNWFVLTICKKYLCVYHCVSECLFWVYRKRNE